MEQSFVTNCGAVALAVQWHLTSAGFMNWRTATVATCCGLWNLGPSFGTCYSCELLVCAGNNELWLLKWNAKKPKCWPLSSSSHKKSVWSVTPPWQRQATSKCVQCQGHYVHQRIYLQSVTTPTAQSWPHTTRFSSLLSLKDNLQRCHFVIDQELQTACASGCRGERATFTSSKMEKDCWNWETLLKNN